MHKIVHQKRLSTLSTLLFYLSLSLPLFLSGLVSALRLTTSRLDCVALFVIYLICWTASTHSLSLYHYFSARICIVIIILLLPRCLAVWRFCWLGVDGTSRAGRLIIVADCWCLFGSFSVCRPPSVHDSSNVSHVRERKRSTAAVFLPYMFIICAF